jgi:hypothetical protein
VTLINIDLDIPVLGFTELLIQDPETLKYDGGYFELLDSAIATVINR